MMSYPAYTPTAPATDRYKIEPGHGPVAFPAPSAKSGYTLKELQKVVGGCIVLVDIPGSETHMMVADEEGQIKGRPLNEVATAMAYQTIVGTVVVILHKDLK